MRVVSYPGHVTVSDVINGRVSGSAEADELRPGVWWIARVFVRPEHRGSGLGTRLLASLMTEVTSQGASEVQVAPGGYGADPARQRAFYVAAGFEGDELMTWKPGVVSAIRPCT